MEEIIRINNLNYLNIFNNFSISFPEKSFISISGPNNCGKTTLIRILDRQVFSNSIFYFQKNINDYPLDEYYKLVKTLIVPEFYFTYDTLEQELLSYLNTSNKEDYLYISKKLKLSSLKKKKIANLDIKDKIKIQLTLFLLENPKLLLIDNIGIYYSKEEFSLIIECLKYFQVKKGLTIILTTSNLEDTLQTDYLYIIYDSQIILKETPLTVLIKDNVLNKLGLRLPFMIDLSVKLKDYNLVDTIELDMKRMADKLWK